MSSDSSSPLSLAGKHVVLLLQGGGALGSYQVGAYEALAAACRDAHTRVGWVGGISIGAINAAVIAGPRGGDAGAELAALWDDILSPACAPFDVTALWETVPPFARAGWLASLVPKYANWAQAALGPLGQPNFFGSRLANPQLNPWIRQWSGPLAPGELAFYDTGRLRTTLDAHVDWDAINRAGAPRLSLGATRVRDGEVTFFQSFPSQNPQWGPALLRADHVLASAALPPAFPAIPIDGELYWDGGISSNTPIAELAEELIADVTTDTIVFLVNLWDRVGPVPRTLDEVVWRQKSIQYGSRKEAAAAVVDAYQLEVEAGHAAPVRFEVCQVMLEWPPDDVRPQFAFADADFARSTYAQLTALGRADMQRAIERPHRVPGVGGTYAALYRHGTYGKHHAADAKYAALRSRREARLRAYERRRL